MHDALAVRCASWNSFLLIHSQETCEPKAVCPSGCFTARAMEPACVVCLITLSLASAI